MVRLLPPFVRRRLAGSATHSAELKQGAVVAFALQMGGVAMGFLQQLGLTHWMTDTAAYGRYVTLMSLALLLASVASLGLPQAVLRFVAAHRGRGDGEGARKVARLAGAMSGMCGLALGLATALGACLIFTVFIPDAARMREVLAVAVWVPLLGLGLVYAAACRGEQRMFLSLFFDRIGRQALLLSAVYLFMRMSGKPDSGQTLWLFTGILAASTAIHVWMYHARPATAGLAGHGGVHHHAQHTPVGRRVLLRVGLPLLLSNGFAVAMGQTDTFLVGTLSGDRDAGVYSVASRISLLAAVSLVIVNSVAAPAVAAMHAKGERVRMARAVASFAHWSFWPSLACIVVIVCFDRQILGLFGPDFIGAKWPMVILLAGQLFNTGCGSVGLLLNMTGHQDDVAKVFAFGAALNIGLNLVLIPPMGITGAAIATSASMAVWNVWLCILVRKRLGIDASILGAFRKHA